jgi:peptide/nickel transport system substrate-binding protein
MRLGRRRLHALVLLPALLALAACNPPRSGNGPPASATGAGAKPARPTGPKKLVLAIEQEPDKLAQVLNSMVYGTYICNTLNSYFVKFNEKMELVPDMLTEVPTLQNGGISADSLTYTYHLRRDVTWHDGKPVTADDVLFTVDAIMHPEHEVEGRTPFDKIVRKEAPDPYTVVFTLSEPYAPFVTDVFFDEAIWPRHLLENELGKDFGSAPYHRAPVGNGPYVFKEWISGSHVTVTANPSYFRGKPAIDQITFRFIPDTNGMLVALKAGEVHGYDNAGTNQLPELRQVPTVTPYITQQLMWEHVDFNTEDPILRDARVRRAIALGIDRDQISREVYGGIWPPAIGDISPKLHWYNPESEKLIRHDPAAASALLDEAGWKLGKDGLRANAKGEPLRLSISTTSGRPQRELVEQVLQQQLRAIGIELTIENHNATAFFAPFDNNGVLKRGKYQLGLYAWISSPDPERYTQQHSSQVPPPEGQNHPRYRSQRMDELQEVGRRTLDEAERKRIYDEVQVLMSTDVPMTSIVWRADIDPMPKRLKNFKPNPTQNGDTWNAWEWDLE